MIDSLSVVGNSRRRMLRLVRAASVLLSAVALLLVGHYPTAAASSLGFDTGGGPNPIVTPIAADPSVVRAPDGTFYMYTTADDWLDGEGMRWMPIFHSANLVDWELVGTVFDYRPAWQPGNTGLWAPDVRLVNGVYTVYYSVGGGADPCIGMATSTSPIGPFTDRGKPVLCSSEVGVGGTIDSFVYQDGPTPIMFVGNFRGIYAITLTADGKAWAGTDPVLVADNRFEAPYIQRHDGYYYMYLSAGNCCNGAASNYRVYVGRSSSLTGPYVDRDGRDLKEGGGDLLLQGSPSWVGPGHNAIVTDDDGTDWLIYHAAPRSQPSLPSGIQNRKGMIDKISWTNGWPSVGDGTPSSTAPAVPSITGQPTPQQPSVGTGSLPNFGSS